MNATQNIAARRARSARRDSRVRSTNPTPPKDGPEPERSRKESVLRDITARLVEVGGKTAQDLGVSRVMGQILVYLYLSPGEQSLDDIGRELGLSKASVSIAARQLETLGFLRRVWIRSDRRNYYRTADHIGPALQQGVLGLINNKIRVLETELAYAEQHLGSAVGTDESSREFMRARVRRAKKLCDFASQILSSPLLKIFTRTLRGNAAAGFL